MTDAEFAARCRRNSIISAKASVAKADRMVEKAERMLFEAKLYRDEIHKLFGREAAMEVPNE